MKHLLLSLGLLVGLAAPAWGQATGPLPTLPTPTAHRGAFYLLWSYNRDWYTRSDIRFRNDKSDDYDFVFHDARAHDHPSMSEFWKPVNLTIPQYDATVGYLFGDRHNLGVEVSWNHLKYVVDDYQLMRVSGQIRGFRFDRDTVVTPDFVHLQHTNGNNYLMLNLVKRWQLRAGRHLRLSAIGKVGGGPMISYTISTVFGSRAEGPFHYEGWVAGASGGLKLDIGPYFFLQSDLQGAYADYTNSYIGADRLGRVTHHFGSAQLSYGFGVNVPL